MCIAGLLDAMRSSLPASVRIIWMCLENHADQTRKWAMSLEKIVSEVNLSIETVARGVRILEANGIVRSQRDGPGRKATVWHMLKSYEPSPHNGGIEPEASPQDAGINGEPSPHNEGIKQPETPQSDGIEMRGSPQNAGISIPAKYPPLIHQVSNPPRKSTSLTRCDAPAAAAASASPRDALWTEGVQLVQALTGAMDRPARSFLGKLLKATNDNASRVLALLREAERQRPLDAAAWLLANARPFRNAGLAVIAEEGLAIEGAAAMERLLALEAKGNA